jgi:Tfp pilus assembly protein PilF
MARVSRRTRHVPAAARASHRKQQAEHLTAVGNQLLSEGKADDALNAYQHALVLDRTLPGVYFNIGNVLQTRGDLQAAVDMYRHALSLAPNYPEAHNNLGNTLRLQGDEAEATQRFQRALELRADYPQPLYNMGNGALAEGRMEEAVGWYERALALSPDFAEAHFNLSLALLAQGDYVHGWPEYEWRWRCAKSIGLPERVFDAPGWAGEDLSGKIILVHTEQGFGDSIQFVRYAVPLRARGATVLLLCEPELLRLMEGASGVDRAFSAEPLPAYDVHAPLHSLPFLLGTQSFRPAKIPYLRLDRGLCTMWQQELSSVEGLKVGLVWAGRTRNDREARRSLAPDQLDGLSEVPGVTLFSLQKEARRTPSGVVQVGDRLSDFADTAALVANLDLVVSADTAVAHLAGALGKPVWLLLPKVPNWRWGLAGEDTRWYPTIRLFRQLHAGDWTDVLERVQHELHRAAEPSARPDKRAAEPSARSRKRAAEPSAGPGKRAAEPSARPRNRAAEPSARPRKRAGEPSARPAKRAAST